MPCETCLDLSSTEISRIPLERLQNSVKSGCPYCSLIYQSLDGLLDLSDIAHFSVYSANSHFRCITVRVILRNGYRPKDPVRELGPAEGHWEDIQIYVPEGVDQEKPGDWITTRYNVPNPASKASFQFIQDMLKECQRLHRCSEMKGQLFPRRVIKVGPPSSPIRVVNFTEDFGPYVALSHCWGGNEHIRLTSSTSGFFQRIPFKTMPATFQDAVQVTRRLKFDYLWIDSLCIVQDDLHDWEIACARMDDIYRNAVLTIAATSSPDSKTSFLTPLTRRRDPVVSVRFRCKDGREFSLRALRCLSFHLEDTHDSEGPLNKRAWCFQENLLSKRVVSYQNSDIKWRCCEVTVCQCMGPSVRYNDVFRIVRTLTNTDKEHALYTWLDVVEEYSGKDLTIANDRLPALSGIASVFHKSFQWTYVAGLWGEHLLDCLCWRSRYLTLKPLQPVAPSFSWASLQSTVHYDRRKDTSQIDVPTQVVGINYIAKGENAFGKVASAHIELEGPVLKARLMCFDSSNWHQYYVECDLLPEWKLFPDTHLAECTIGTMKVAARCAVGKPEELGSVPIWILCLAFALEVSGMDSIDAIALRPLDDERECFERIGILQDVGPNWDTYEDISELSEGHNDTTQLDNDTLYEDDDISELSQGNDPFNGDDDAIQNDDDSSQADENMAEMAEEGNSSRGDISPKREDHPSGRPFEMDGGTYDPWRTWQILKSNAETRRVKIF